MADFNGVIMKISLYQMHIAWENKEENYYRVNQELKAAYERNIDLFILPEMSFTGFSMNTDVTKECNYETINRMSGFAKQYHMALGFGWVKDCGNKSENHYTVISKEGKVISDYAKIHPFSYSGEDEKFQGGEDIVCFELQGIKFSNFICYDLRFPEIFQIASKDAHVIIVSANWPEKRREHWKCLLQARAIENQTYILAVNCIGNIGGLDYSGDSCIINPNGEVVAELPKKEGILEYELIDDVNDFRNAFQIKNDRREELYYKYIK